MRKIVDALDSMEPAAARYLARFAYVLGRVARADMAVDPEETRVMERIVRERSGLSESQAVIAVQIAKSQNALFGGTLVPSLDVVLVLSTDPSGALSVSGAWPAGVAGGTVFFAQYLTVDPGAAHGVAFSNAIAGISPY